MKTGMLWYHDASDGVSGKQLEKLLQKAISDYYQWYGIHPSVCYLNLKELGNHRRRLPSLHLELSPSEQLAPGQFWLG